MYSIYFTSHIKQYAYITKGIAVAGGTVLLAIATAIICIRRQSNAKKAIQVTGSCNKQRPPLVTPRVTSDIPDHTRIQRFHSGSDGYLYPKTEDIYLEARDDIKKQTYLEIVNIPEDPVYETIESHVDVIN